MKEVAVLVGAGSISQAIARRVSWGRHIVVADVKEENADKTAKILNEAGFETSVTTVDVACRQSIKKLVSFASEKGTVMRIIHAAGVSPSQAPKDIVLRVDLYGTAVLLEEFRQVLVAGTSAVVISSQSGYRLPALTEQENASLALSATDDLLALPLLEQVKDSLHAYQLAKRGNSLRVAAESVLWGEKGARVNVISPGIVMTPLALDELNGPRGAGYKAMLEATVTKRAGMPDEIAALAELIMGENGQYINGSDFLIDGGVTANYWYGNVDEVR